MMNSVQYLTTDIEDKDPGCNLGLIIKSINHQQRHTGFIFIKDSVPILAHFGWSHCFLYHKMTEDDKYAIYWINLSKIPDIVAIQIINELELISLNNEQSENGKVYSLNADYGIIYSGQASINEGKYSSPYAGDGLTCATFVNLIFEKYDFPMLDLESWDNSSEDKAWQEQIIEQLKKSGINEEFIQIQQENIGNFPRIRPEQMVGACIVFNYEPVNYTKANEAGTVVKNELVALNY